MSDSKNGGSVATPNNGTVTVNRIAGKFSTDGVYLDVMRPKWTADVHQIPVLETRKGHVIGWAKLLGQLHEQYPALKGWMMAEVAAKEQALQMNGVKAIINAAKADNEDALEFANVFAAAMGNQAAKARREQSRQDVYRYIAENVIVSGTFVPCEPNVAHTKADGTVCCQSIAVVYFDFKVDITDNFKAKLQ